MTILESLVNLATPYGISIVAIVTLLYLMHRIFNYMNRESELAKLNEKYELRIEDLSRKLEATTESYKRVTKALDLANEQLATNRAENAPLIRMYHEILIQYTKNLQQNVSSQNASNTAPPK